MDLLTLALAKKYTNEKFSGSAAVGWSKEIVNILPTVGDENTIYLVKQTDFSGNIYYDEYLYTNGKYDAIGTTKTDLENYVQVGTFDELTEKVDNKVDKENNKGLSTNDYTTAEKSKLSAIEVGANKTIVDNKLSDTSDNPVANSAIYAELNKQYEVIETVTTEEEISAFSRSQEPDGTTYGFDRMKVLIEIAAAESASAITVKMQKDSGSNWVYYYTNSSGITTAKQYISCEGYKNYGYWENKTQYGSSEYSIPTITGMSPRFWSFDEAKTKTIGYLLISGNLPIGTKITILGVRA